MGFGKGLSFLGNLFSKGRSIANNVNRSVGGIQGANRKFGNALSIGRKFGTIVDKISGNAISNSKLGEKINSANEKVETFKKNFDSAMPDITSAVQELKTL